MRLIDADRLKEVFDRNVVSTGIWNDIIDKQPTALEEQQGDTWIPITDELPQKDYAQRLLVTLKNEMVIEAWYINNKFKHMDFNGLDEISKHNPAIAWMPLPTPYKEEKHEANII